MADYDELKLLDAFELETPSRHVDRIIRSFARTRLEEVRIRRRRTRFVGWLSAAAALLVVTGLVWTGLYVFASRPGQPAPAGRAPSGTVAAVDVNTAVEMLRTEIEQIDEMTELIPRELASEREEITERIRACLADLEQLELEIGKGNPTSCNPTLRRKEINV